MVHLLLVIIYISFVSLGLPDALLGAAWPMMHLQFEVPVSYMGAVSLVIAAGTVVSSLMSDRMTKRFGTGMVTAISVATTAAALLGFASSSQYWHLILWAIPYGLGAGAVDAGLNNYVAIHCASRHMSWVHCMWSLGASTGPVIMGWVLTGGQAWNNGYLYMGILQVVLSVILFISLPLWKKSNGPTGETKDRTPLSLGQIFRIPGAKAVMLTFFCYCAIEATAGQWASSYLVMHTGLAEEEAASLASLFYVGVTVGRALSGFATIKFNDRQMVYIGMGILMAGLIIMLLPLGKLAAMTGLVLTGLGCAPIYPCILHATPDHFGADKSQAIIGVQMASAYVGICLMPPIFGMIADWAGIRLLPAVLLAILAVMFTAHERLYRMEAKRG